MGSAASYNVVPRFTKLPDDELLLAARRQPEAFGVFYERHVADILAYHVHATGNYETALDLTAEVFAAALAAVDRYRPGEAPAKAWLLGIARNKLLEVRRGRARADAARRRLGIARIRFDDVAFERVEEIIDAQRLGYLDDIDVLTPDEQRAVIARVIEEKDYSEVAATTGVSEGTIRKRVSRGLARLARRKTGMNET